MPEIFKSSSAACAANARDVPAFTPILLQGADRRKTISNEKRVLAKQILFPQKEVLSNGKTE